MLQYRACREGYMRKIELFKKKKFSDRRCGKYADIFGFKDCRGEIWVGLVLVYSP